MSYSRAAYEPEATGLRVTVVLPGLRGRRALAGSIGNWISSGFGLGLTIGGILARPRAAVGAIGVGRGVERLVDLADEVAAAGRPPTPEQRAALDRMSASLERHGKLDLVLVLLTTAVMASARYW